MTNTMNTERYTKFQSLILYFTVVAGKGLQGKKQGI